VHPIENDWAIPFKTNSILNQIQLFGKTITWQTRILANYLFIKHFLFSLGRALSVFPNYVTAFSCDDCIAEYSQV
jgi:hypothetical protein